MYNHISLIARGRGEGYTEIWDRNQGKHGPQKEGSEIKVIS